MRGYRENTKGAVGAKNQKRRLAGMLAGLLLFSLVGGLLPTMEARAATNVSTWDALYTAMKNGGDITLTSDVTGSSAIGATGLQVPNGKTVTLDLAGHTIDRGLSSSIAGVQNNNGYVIEVNGTLTLRDSVGGGKITGGYSRKQKYAGGVTVNGTFNMEGGIISGNKGVSGDGQCADGVYVALLGTFILDGGSVVCTEDSSRAVKGSITVGNVTAEYGGGGNTFSLEKNKKTIGFADWNTWVKTKHTISFNANNGSGAPSSLTQYYGDTVTLPSTQPTRSGYSFQGWAASSTATTAKYAAGGSYIIHGDETLYAVWQAVPATVTTAPTAKTLTYNGSDQELVTAGAASNGTMYYKVDSGSYSASIPKKKTAGTYTVSYRGASPQMDRPFANMCYPAQFSIFRSSTLKNSFSLLVTTVYPKDLAWPAIIISSGPIGVPFFSSVALIFP